MTCALRLHEHMLASLLCPERATISNLICTSGQHHKDWTAHYRLYSKDRVDERVIFTSVRECVQQALPKGEPLVVAIDDSLLLKCGTHIHGAGWKRDPLGPPFQTNLVRAQRYLQFSAAWPLHQGDARTIPIGFYHTPGVPKPAKGASPQELKAHREVHKQCKLNEQCLLHMKTLRDETPAELPIVFTGDGSYSNQTLLRGLPAGSLYIGRMRKDAVLHYPPPRRSKANKGRPLNYGALAPTPEELRADEQVPWQKVQAFAAGKRHEFRIKSMGPVLWRKCGADIKLRIIVIAPLAYQLRKGSRILYRQPAYLVCSDMDIPLEKVIQYYLWRWGIEVNFREQKTLIGTGDAQLRSAASNQHQPAVSVSSYSLLWCAALQMHEEGEECTALTLPKWRHPAHSHGTLPSTGELLRQLRYESWSGALRPSSFYHFVHPNSDDTTRQKPSMCLPATLFAAA